MLWAANRQTTRVEDQAYSLMGIFDVNMPLLYGEGPKAFQRLQENIVKQTNDQSILAFCPLVKQRTVLAEDPGWFLQGLETHQQVLTKPMAIVSQGIQVDVILCNEPPGRSLTSGFHLAVLDCSFEGLLDRLGILLKCRDTETQTFSRISFDNNYPVCFRINADGNMRAIGVYTNNEYGKR
jgi:hypothetical protein